MKKIFAAFALSLLAVPMAFAQRGFAIVIDAKSQHEAAAEVQAYADAIAQTQGLHVYTVVDRWGVPDSIKSELYRLYTQKKNPIEGAVFIGDIPVPMIRDAQHLTTAFKMNQKHDRRESSIPSDRYYDDFDLKFQFLGADTLQPYYYYSLTAEAPQYLQADIYTGRIRPTDAGGTSRYAKLRSYLRKAVAEKQRQNVLDQVLYFGGHGFISESMMARIDEKQGLYEHFPWLRQQQNGISFIDHSQADEVKHTLMNEVMRPDLDFAILHHHGSSDTQYLNEIPKPISPEQAKAFMQGYVRAHLRAAQDRGKNVDEVKQKLLARFDMPESWIADTFTPESILKDSLDNDALDLHLHDFAGLGYTPNAPLVMIDACFCGAFHLDNCIANAYIFSPGKTVACIANSVNVLQDKWSDKFIGLLGLGMNAGNIARFSNYLESHVIGDPTFRFTSANAKTDVQRILAKTRPAGWKKYLKSPVVDLQALAIEQLRLHGLITSDQLLDLFKTSESALVRMAALTNLAEIGDDRFVEALALACNDSYELVQRYGVRYLGKSGDLRLIPAMIRLAITNNTSERTNFNLMNSISFFPQEPVLQEFDRQFNSPAVQYVHKDKVGRLIRKTLISNTSKWTEDVDAVIHPDTSDKVRKRCIRTLRNYCPHHRIPELLRYVESCRDEQMTVMFLEALGWQEYSCRKGDIIAVARRMSQDTQRPAAVRAEALKTVNRLH